MSNHIEASPQGLYTKILAAQKAIEAVPKRGFNAFHKYHYATEADILTVKQTLNAQGLVVLPTTVAQQTGIKADGKSWATVTLLFRVVDVDSGEVIESQFTGYAEDNFDKAIYKATTGANKYFYLKFFGIATEDDPEREDALPSGAAISVSSSSKAYRNPEQRTATQSTTHSKTINRGVPAAERTTSTADAGQSRQGDISASLRSQAFSKANQILSLQKQYNLSNEEIIHIGKISSIRELAEEGRVSELEMAYQNLQAHLQPNALP